MYLRSSAQFPYLIIWDQFVNSLCVLRNYLAEDFSPTWSFTKSSGGCFGSAVFLKWISWFSLLSAYKSEQNCFVRKMNWKLHFSCAPNTEISGSEPNVNVSEGTESCWNEGVWSKKEAKSTLIKPEITLQKQCFLFTCS